MLLPSFFILLFFDLRYLPLLKKMREFQEYWHKPIYKDWDVLFTSGSMDGCSKIFEMTLETGDPVMVQVPTYDGILNAVNLHIRLLFFCFLFFFFFFLYDFDLPLTKTKYLDILKLF